MVAPRSASRFFPFFVVATFLCLLSACSGDDRLAVCPRVGVLYDAEHVTNFAPGQPKTTQSVTYDAEIFSPTIKCDYDEDVVTSDIEVTFDVLRGPMGRPGKKEFRYFVAVTELNQTVLQKKYYTVDVDFDDDQRRAAEKAEVNNIKVNYSRLGRADLYEILVGWDLTPEELAYNRNTSPFDRPNMRRVRRP